MRVLLVCMGNICRSPIAEGVLRRHFATHCPELAVEFDSAGTHAYHVGEPPDPRAIDHARRRGVDIAALHARQVEDSDFESFDLILAMDEDNLARLATRCPPRFRDRLRLLLEFAPQCGARAVPDPYYGGGAGFERVLDLVEAAACGLVAELQAADRASIAGGIAGGRSGRRR